MTTNPNNLVVPEAPKGPVGQSVEALGAAADANAKAAEGTPQASVRNGDDLKTVDTGYTPGTWAPGSDGRLYPVNAEGKPVLSAGRVLMGDPKDTPVRITPQAGGSGSI